MLHPLPGPLARAVIVLSVVSLCASCTLMRSNRAERAQNEMIGMSKIDLYSCAGVPNRTEMVDGVEFATYEGGGDTRGYVGGGGQQGVGGGATATMRRYCHANFVIRNGRVAKVTYTGRSGGYFTEGEQCAFIVDKCLSNR